MLSKEERKLMNQVFWTRFKEQAGIFKGENGNKINWVNYPTRLKPLYIRLTVDKTCARFSIEIQDKDEGIRDIIWEQMIELKKVLETEMGTYGEWEKIQFNLSNQPISRISWIKEDINIYHKEDHQKAYDFLIDTLRRFDRFYNTYGDILIGLVK
ncbi:hypothetical protein CW751_08845 [Brumimicrobium salinarum]|uniref:DUF4268 domain-containing protein n=1 Tax=Brumimicrobium salinarum TaxID=2058658 RepID=A0A2I0R1L6_9FLAO|nr:DUF4268 domain-containing protein [Brumimicrobium salinarum]PKR80474.1 hypothetical protein CW751_08845 [Brumimicrobium salinarum]